MPDKLTIEVVLVHQPDPNDCLVDEAIAAVTKAMEKIYSDHPIVLNITITHKQKHQ